MMHGRFDEANQAVSSIEREVMKVDSTAELPPPQGTMLIRPQGAVKFTALGRVMLRDYATRTALGLSLMAGQAFLYSAVFFTYGLVLTTFYKVPASSVGLYLIPFAIGNILGPLMIGRLFDTVGRRQMITFTYVISGVLLAITGLLFLAGILNAVTETICWCVIFFFASASASFAYLTVSEIFPLETRAMAIALFYAGGTAIGGMLAPILFGALIQSGKSINVFYGYLVGAILMAGAGLIELIWGVAAEREPLESIARPLSAAEPAMEGASYEPSMA
jgi:MFS family permease